MLPVAHVDARCTAERSSRHRRTIMFIADRTLGVNRWPLVKLQQNSRTEVVLLSSRFFALTTHWANGTVPCPGDDCPLCCTLPARGLLYLAVHSFGRTSILELGSLSAANFEQHAKLLHGGMIPGLKFQLSRKGAKHPIHSEVIGSQSGVEEIKLFDLCRHVMSLYKFPCPNPSETLETYESRCRDIARVRCERLAHVALKHSGK